MFSGRTSVEDFSNGSTTSCYTGLIKLELKIFEEGKRKTDENTKTKEQNST